MWDFDVVVIGGGLLGCFTARNLCRRKLHIALLEAREDVCTGISRANTAIVYPGYDHKPGTLKAKTTVRANEEFDRLCRTNSLFRYGEGRGRLLDAAIKKSPFDSVIKYEKNEGSGYVLSSTRGGMRVVSTPGSAKRYRDEKAAEAAIKSLKKRFISYNFSVEKI